MHGIYWGSTLPALLKVFKGLGYCAWLFCRQKFFHLESFISIYFIRMHVSQIHSYGETNIKCGGVLGLEALHWFWGGFRTTDFVSISSDQITQCGFFFFFWRHSDPIRFLLLGCWRTIQKRFMLLESCNRQSMIILEMSLAFVPRDSFDQFLTLRNIYCP